MFDILFQKLTKETSVHERALAAELLGDLRDVRAVDPLLSALGHPEPSLGAPAAMALGKLGGVVAFKALAVKLRAKNADNRVRAAAAHGLGEIRHARALEPLLAALSTDNFDTFGNDVRAEAAWALGRIAEPQAVGPLIEALEVDDPRVKKMAAAALGEIGDKRAVEPFIAALKTQSDRSVICEAAAKALGKLKDLRAVDVLLTKVTAYYRPTQLAAVEALGRLGDKKAIAALVPLLKDDYLPLVETARAALGLLDPVRFPPQSPFGDLGALDSTRAATVPLVADGKIRFKCPNCSAKIIAPLASAGKKNKCPGCHGAVSIPEIIDESVRALAQKKGGQAGEIQRLNGHSGAIMAVAWSTDGKWVLSSSGAELGHRSWSIIDGKEIHRWGAEAGTPIRIAFTPDGRRATSIANGEVSYWDLTNTKEIHRSEHSQGVLPSADGQRVLCSKGFCGAFVYDCQTGKVACPIWLSGNWKSDKSVAAVAPDGRHAVIQLENDRTVVVSLDTGKEESVLEQPQRPHKVNTLALSTGTRYVLAGGSVGVKIGEYQETVYVEDVDTPYEVQATKYDVREEGWLALWDAKTGGEIRRFEKHPSQVRVAILSPDAQYALSGSADGVIRYWKVDSGEQLSELKGHNGPITCMVYSADGRFVLSGSEDQTIRVWALPK